VEVRAYTNIIPDVHVKIHLVYVRNNQGEKKLNTKILKVA
jgi:hypothetical protein